jgi:hypothetical protein
MRAKSSEMSSKKRSHILRTECHVTVNDQGREELSELVRHAVVGCFSHAAVPFVIVLEIAHGEGSQFIRRVKYSVDGFQILERGRPFAMTLAFGCRAPPVPRGYAFVCS